MFNNSHQISKNSYVKEPLLKIKINKIFGNIFLIFGLIPWVNFGLNDYDSQPWTFIFSIFFLATISNKIKLPKHSIGIFFLTILGLFFTILLTESIDFFITTRAVIGYLSLPLLYVGFYNYFALYGLPIKMFIYFNLIWISFGIIELFLPEFVQLISNLRTSESRGVTSLAPEPTYYGIYLFFISWIIVESKNLVINNKIIFLLIINFFCIIFLSKSTTVLLYAIIVLTFFLINQLYAILLTKKILIKNFFVFLLGFVIFLIIFLLLNKYYINTRLFIIFNDLINIQNFHSFILNDQSIHTRLESIYFSVVGTFKNYFLPGGLDSLVEMRKEIAENLKSDIFINLFPSLKIMSWNGTIFYELGFFGILIVILFFKAIYRNFSGSFLYFLTLFIILFSAIPIGFTLAPMLFSLMSYNQKNKFLENRK